MMVRVITLRFSATYDGFDDTPLVEFVRGKEVLGVREYFFERNDAPYLAMVVTYAPPPVAQPRPDARAEKKGDDSWRSLLTHDDEPVFESLRDWRAGRAKAEGVPPYVLFTNRHLAEIAHSRPLSLAALAQIEGIGQAKCSKYGEAVLGVLGVERAPHEPEDAMRPGAGSSSRVNAAPRPGAWSHSFLEDHHLAHSVVPRGPVDSSITISGRPSPGFSPKEREPFPEVPHRPTV
jgi:ATP-dependent DNA helicase RecQ